MTAKTMTESVAQYTGHLPECPCDTCLIAGALWSDGYVAGSEAMQKFQSKRTEEKPEVKS